MNKNPNWDPLVNDLVDNADTYHKYYYERNNFTGPSLHFHHRALKAADHEKAEMVYALLVSWGMHRMGGGPQMTEFKVFSKSLEEHLTEIQSLASKTYDNITEEEFNRLEVFFSSMKAMNSSKRIVAMSKILAHYLPGLIAPIDNEYTFRFIFRAPRHPTYWDEFHLFREIHWSIIRKLVLNEQFKLTANKWLNNPGFPWDSSLPKIVDNLIIGKMGQEKTRKKKNKP